MSIVSCLLGYKICGYFSAEWGPVELGIVNYVLIVVSVVLLTSIVATVIVLAVYRSIWYRAKKRARDAFLSITVETGCSHTSDGGKHNASTVPHAEVSTNGALHRKGLLNANDAPQKSTSAPTSKGTANPHESRNLSDDASTFNFTRTTDESTSATATLEASRTLEEVHSPSRHRPQRRANAYLPTESSSTPKARKLAGSKERSPRKQVLTPVN